MKKLVLVIIFILSLTIAPSSQAMEFYFCGINIKSLKNMNTKEAIVGAIVSLATHVTGHLLCLELQDKEWRLEYESFSLREYTLDPLSDKENRWFSRSGFLLQNLVGLGLSSFQGTRNTDFTKGYTLFNLTEIAMYPRHQDGGDFHSLDEHDGQGDMEWSLYSVIALYNLSNNFDLQK